MNGPRLKWMRPNEAGFTVVEILIYLVIASVVMTSVYQLMIKQSQTYADQREAMDVRESVRGAAVLLAAELRQVSAAGGDLYSIQPTSLALRSIRGSSIVCAWDPVAMRVGLWGVTGQFDATPDDSALVFVVGDDTPGDDTWRVFDITADQTGGGWGMANCAWPSNPPTERILTGSGDTTGIAIGAPFRAFRRIEYGLFQDASRWWLGRRVGGSTTWEKLTGPLRYDGLIFSYYDASGTVTTIPAAVRTVEIVIRGESSGKSPLQGGSGERQDSVRTRVFLRG